MNSYLNRVIIPVIITLLIPFGLSAHVQLDYPEGGETFYSGNTIDIKWTEVIHHNTLNWELYFSSDGGITWQVIDDDIDYELRKFTWEIPAQGTTMGRIKVVQNNIGTNYESESDDFTIVNVSGIDPAIPSVDLFKSAGIFPNPSIANCTLGFNLNQPAQLNIEVYNLAGKRMFIIPKKQYPAGKKEIPLDIQGLPPGDYFCMIKSENAGKTLRFRIVH